MKIFTTPASPKNASQTPRASQNDIIDAALFEFIKPLAPNMTALYNHDKPTQNTAKLSQFVNGNLDRVHVRSQFVTNVYDCRAAILKMATYAFITRQAMTAHSLDLKSASALADSKIATAYKNVVTRAIAANLFTLPANKNGKPRTRLNAIMLDLATKYANGEIIGAPFALLAIAPALARVTTRGNQSASQPASQPAPALDLDLDAALDAQFSPASQTPDAPALDAAMLASQTANGSENTSQPAN